MENMTGANAELVGLPISSGPTNRGKMAASHQISSNGVFTTGDLAESSAAQGKIPFRSPRGGRGTVHRGVERDR